MTEFKIKELIFLTFLSLQIVGNFYKKPEFAQKILIMFFMFWLSESLRQCVGCKEKVKIKWEKVRPNIIMKMKIDSKSKNIELQKSPLVLDPYDPHNQDTCIFEGYWDANKHNCLGMSKWSRNWSKIFIRMIPEIGLNYHNGFWVLVRKKCIRASGVKSIR